MLFLYFDIFSKLDNIKLLSFEILSSYPRDVEELSGTFLRSALQTTKDIESITVELKNHLLCQNAQLDFSYLEKRLSFLNYICSEKASPEKAFRYIDSNFITIIEKDIPPIYEKLRTYVYKNFSPTLLTKLSPLLSTTENGAIIQKSFSILKDCIAYKYKIDKTKDGDAFYSSFFDKPIQLNNHSEISEKQRNELKKLINAAYSHFRNRTAHSSANFTLSELEAALSVINYLFQKLDLNDTSF